MPADTLPALDQNICSRWTEVQRDFYNKLPVYFAKFNSEYRKDWDLWTKLVPNKFKWQPNMGDVMRRIAQERSPILRQEAHPELITDVPTTDIYYTHERSHEVRIYRHRFVSRDFHFYPEFADFLQHLDYEKQDLQRQIHNYYELFLRTRIFHASPYVYVVGVGLVDALTGVPNSAGTAGKTNAWIQQQLEKCNGALSLEELFKVLSVAETDVGMTPYEGSGKPSGESKPLDERFCLVTGSETWNQFVNDPWTKENRPLNMNIVTDKFQGDLFGRIRCRLEQRPLRYAITNSGAAATLSTPQPEITLEDADRDTENGRTAPFQTYARTAQYAVSFLIGGNFGSAMEVGAPPSMFTKSVEAGMGMDWNGKIIMNKNFLTQCKDGAGNAQLDTNSWGEYIRLQAQLSMGYAPDNAYNVLPIIHERRVGITSVGAI